MMDSNRMTANSLEQKPTKHAKARTENAIRDLEPVGLSSEPPFSKTAMTLQGVVKPLRKRLHEEPEMVSKGLRNLVGFSTGRP